MAQQLSNAPDVGRTWPVADLAPRVQTDADSPVLELVVGPAIAGFVDLANPALGDPILVVSYVTATRAWELTPVKAVGVEYSFLRSGPNAGKARITNLDGVNHADETWAVWYKPATSDGTVGGQSSVLR
jgi:hypothetical protein